MLQSDFIRTRWAAFQDNPLPGIHADALASSLNPLKIINEETVRTAMSGSGAGAKLSELLQHRYSLAPLSALTPLSDQEAFAASMSVQEWQTMRMACGTVFWSDTLSREVCGSTLRLLDEHLGHEWWQWVEEGLTRTDDREPLAALAAGTAPAQAWSLRIHHIGSTLLSAWRQALDPALAGWVRLKDGTDDGRFGASAQLTDPTAIAAATRMVARVSAVLTERTGQIS